MARLWVINGYVKRVCGEESLRYVHSKRSKGFDVQELIEESVLTLFPPRVKKVWQGQCVCPFVVMLGSCKEAVGPFHRCFTA